MASEATFLMQQFLRWLDERPRRPAEVRDAWSSACPLNCAWEDALADDLVGYDPDGRVVLSAQGRSLLAGRADSGNGARNPQKPAPASAGFAPLHPPYA